MPLKPSTILCKGSLCEVPKPTTQYVKSLLCIDKVKSNPTSLILNSEKSMTFLGSKLKCSVYAYLHHSEVFMMIRTLIKQHLGSVTVLSVQNMACVLVLYP